MQEPDPTAIRAAMAGDPAAFESLVRAYQVPVWRFLRHLLGDGALAEDVTQETFVRLFVRLPTFSFRSKFSTWVFQVARNCGIDAVRSRDRRDRLARSLPLPAPATDPDQRAQINAALATLRPAMREALLLVEVLGLSYAEASAVTGSPEGTLKSRVFKARQDLHRWRAQDRHAGEDAR